jgi:hypothetical protein
VVAHRQVLGHRPEEECARASVGRGCGASGATDGSTEPASTAQVDATTVRRGMFIRFPFGRGPALTSCCPGSGGAGGKTIRHPSYPSETLWTGAHPWPNVKGRGSPPAVGGRRNG